MTTDLDSAIVKVLNCFMDQEFTEIEVIVDEERITDQQELIVDQCFRTFRNYAYGDNLYNPNYILVEDFSTQAKYELMKKAIAELGDDLPQAFFVANNTLAIGVLRALQEAGVIVPDRVSLISFDDTPLTEQASPALSNIAVYTGEMGRITVDVFDRQLVNHNTAPAVTRPTTTPTLQDSTNKGHQ